MTFNTHALAIIEAQWRVYRNHFRKVPSGTIATILFALFWYGMWSLFAASAIPLFASLSPSALAEVLPLSLMGIFFFWQVFPILLVSSGMSLDLRKLRPYPIPLAHLYWLEVLLRTTAAFEMVLILGGISIGLLRNPRVALWAPFVLLLYGVLNLFLSTALRDMLARAFARKRYRELISIILLLLIALPQLLISTTVSHSRVSGWTNRLNSPIWPWTAASSIVRGHGTSLSWLSLLAWIVAAFAFSRWQFRRTFDFDADQTAVRTTAPRRFAFVEAFYTLPSRLFRDPLAAIIEKEIRFLSRAPRFRVLFIMGFSFGIVIFLPTFFRSRQEGGFLANNFLTMIGSYSLLLLGEVLFWNNMGFDRSAAQAYFVTPVRFRTVLMGKNIAAAFFAMLEIGMLIVVSTVFRLALRPMQIVEAVCTILVLTLFLTAIGNLSSVRNGRPVNPSQAMRGTGAGRAQMMLFLLYPIAFAPLALAFGARYAFESDLAFYLVILLDLAIGATVYHIALESAEATALRRQEELLADLSKGEGLVSA